MQTQNLNIPRFPNCFSAYRLPMQCIVCTLLSVENMGNLLCSMQGWESWNPRIVIIFIFVFAVLRTSANIYSFCSNYNSLITGVMSIKGSNSPERQQKMQPDDDLDNIIKPQDGMEAASPLINFQQSSIATSASRKAYLNSDIALYHRKFPYWADVALSILIP